MTARMILMLSLCGGALLPGAAVQNAPSGTTPAEDDWPMARHDAHNTGASADVVPVPLHLSWRTSVCKAFAPVLLSSEGIVCAASAPQSVGDPEDTFMYDSSGRLLWRIKNATPLYLKGPLLLIAARNPGDAQLECYAWKSQQKQWSQPLGGSLENVFGAIVDSGHLYLSFSVRPLDATTGKPGFMYAALKSWNVQTGGSLASRRGGIQEWAVGPPACDGKYVYYGISHWLHVLDAQTLMPQFSFYDGGNAYPICQGDVLIAKGWLGYINAWNTTTRKAVWSCGGPRDIPHCLTQDSKRNGLLIESSTALDAATSHTVWRNPVFVAGKSAAGAKGLVFLAGGRSYRTAAGKGGFYAFDTDSGKPRWAYEKPNLTGETVIVSGGKVYGTGADGFLYCFAPNRPAERKTSGEQEQRGAERGTDTLKGTAEKGQN